MNRGFDMAKNKWVSFFLCLFLGVLGIHKFYEGRVLLGILYLCTGGLFLIGVIIDLISLFFKPNPYYP
jgi:TM2 domain-containing membrane protein YozV